MPPSSGGLLSVSQTVSQSHSQTMAHAQLHSRTWPIYTGVNLFVRATMQHASYIFVSMLMHHAEEKKDCQITRQRAVTFLMTYNALNKRQDNDSMSHSTSGYHSRVE